MPITLRLFLSHSEAVERVYPKMMKAVRAQKTTRTNIRLTHIGVLLKGLMIIYRTQLQELKSKRMDGEDNDCIKLIRAAYFFFRRNICR